MTTRRQVLALGALGLAGACAAPRARPVEPAAPDPEPSSEPGFPDEIVICGRRQHIHTPVVLWSDAGGYDATSTALAFPDSRPAEPPQGLRYAPGRKRSDGLAVGPDADPVALARVVDQFVLHYDTCGTSRRCFKILHDYRGLSVHFMLDLDGTLYQTLDLVHTAWHARQANARSVGVEIAHPGAFAPGSPELEKWYTRDASGVRLVLPEGYGNGSLRDPHFSARPRRPQPLRGYVQGQDLVQYDFTAEQYQALWHLSLGLNHAFARLPLSVPRDARGRVREDVLSDAEFATYRGILGHNHVSDQKTDPGPAFDWSALPGQVAS